MPTGGQTPGDTDDLIFARSATRFASTICPIALFEDLLSAFRQDVVTTRYATWDDVLDYCRRSANPVGRLVLRVAGYDDAAARRPVGRGLHGAAADQLLAGSGDRLAPRPPVPAARGSRPRRRGARRDLDAGTHDARSGARRFAPSAARTRELFEPGRPVCDAVRGRLRWELRLTWLGAIAHARQARRGRFRRLPPPSVADAADAPGSCGRRAMGRRALMRTTQHVSTAARAPLGG